MNRRTVRDLALGAVLVAGLALLLVSGVRSQVNAAPSFVPIGVSSSGATSTVWFHEPSTRQAVACQTVQQGPGLSGIQCVATKLP